MKRLKQWLCSHEVCWTDGVRLPAGGVKYPCRKCGKVLEGPYGIAIDARWVPPTKEDLDKMYGRPTNGH